MKPPSLAAQVSDDTQAELRDIFTPALVRALSWMPKFMIDSPVTMHVPMFYWLSCVLRPRRVIVLGANDGMAYFAFCEALEHLGAHSYCEAFGFWSDKNAEERRAPPPDNLKEHQEALYRGFSRLISCVTLDEALDHIKQQTVDLLFCDVGALPAGTQLSCDRLLGFLSKPGVLLLHGTREAKQNNVGICGLDGFADTSYCVNFPEENGLTVVCSDGDLPIALQPVLNMAVDGFLRRDLEQLFLRSGQSLQAIAVGTADAKALQYAEKSVVDTQNRLQQTCKELSALRESYDLCRAALVKAQLEVFDLRGELAEVAALLSAAEAEAADALNSLKDEQTARFKETEALVRMSEEIRHKLGIAQAALVERAKECDAACLEAKAAIAAQTKAEAALTSAQAKGEAAKAELQAERHIRFEETATLTRLVEDLRGKIRLDAEDYFRKLQEADEEKDQIQRHNQELLNSTSWRITAPMRWTKAKIRFFLQKNRN